MIKKLFMLAGIFTLLDGGVLLSYVKVENLFYSMENKIIAINGFDAFNELVVKKSQDFPVVVQVYSSEGQGAELEALFKEVADKFEGSVQCSVLDVSTSVSDQFKQENGMIVNQALIDAYGLSSDQPAQRVDLPVYILFSKGTSQVLNITEGMGNQSFSQELYKDALFKAISSLIAQ